MNDAKVRILIADDEEPILSVLKDTFHQAHYDVLATHDGQEAWDNIEAFRPDVIVLDRQMPRLSGTEVCEKLKGHLVFRHIPVLLLTGLSTTHDKVDGLEVGADDYLTKPFDVDELLARIHSLLRRTNLGLEANPLTRLPGNVSIERELIKRLESKNPFAVLYADLDHFKAFNDVYGFVKGDEVIRRTAQLLSSLSDRTQDFVGHVGGDDFVIVTIPSRVETLCQSIVRQFDHMSPDFYNAEDRARGSLISHDRRGQEMQFPLLSLSIAVVTNEKRTITSLGEISTIGAEMKHVAKTMQGLGSHYAIDRRHDGRSL